MIAELIIALAKLLLVTIADAASAWLRHRLVA